MGSAVAQLPAATAVPYAAQTVTGATRQGAVSAGGIAWQCIGNRCNASGPAVAPVASACAELARMVGRIASYSYGSNRLIDLSQCNASASAIGAAGAITPGVAGAVVTAPSATGAPQPPKLQSTDKTALGGSSSAIVAPVTLPQIKPLLTTPEIKAGATPATPDKPTGTAGGPIRTVTLQFRGSGASLAEINPAFTPLRVTTVALQFRGSGASLAEFNPAFTPVTVRTVPLQVRAAGSLP